MISVHDLRTRDGVIGYVESTLLQDVRTAFDRNGSIAAFGVVFAAQVNGTPTNMPHPIMVGGMGMNSRQIKRAMQKVTNASRAIGCLYVRQDEFGRKPGDDGARYTTHSIVVQLEHRTVEDLIWSAPILGKKLGDFTQATLSAGMLDLKRTAFMPERWMH